MRKIEEKYADDVVVIGVHSGKYIAERETARIREASLRYDITHPIVNDRQFRVWRAYAVRAWPTLTVIDRNGYVVGAHAGEFTAEMVDPLLSALVSMSAPAQVSAVPHSVERSGIAPSILRYPGKVAVEEGRIAISDTGNHRVLVGRMTTSSAMRVEQSISSFTARPELEISGFIAPQGLAFASGRLYVTDSEAHVICAVDPETGRTRVLAGTGTQMRTQGDRAAGALSSPWDLAIVGRTAYVAMAGIHQIWRVDLDSGRSRVHCGTGGEDIVDAPNSDALLAQPMGITTNGTELYFADAESSAIRRADIDPAGRVTTIVGTGLFDFGDVDGVGDSVRMQHQQGVALKADGALLVADSYNNCLKWVDVESRAARTWLRGFHEPGGVAIDARYAYVADTNAHRIVVADLATGDLKELEISS